MEGYLHLSQPPLYTRLVDLEEDPIAFFPNPIDVMQFYIPRMALGESAYENKLPLIDRLQWPHRTMAYGTEATWSYRPGGHTKVAASCQTFPRLRRAGGADSRCAYSWRRPFLDVECGCPPITSREPSGAHSEGRRIAGWSTGVSTR
jgi:hypothetical protein